MAISFLISWFLNFEKSGCKFVFSFEISKYFKNFYPSVLRYFTFPFVFTNLLWSMKTN